MAQGIAKSWVALAAACLLAAIFPCLGGPDGIALASADGQSTGTLAAPMATPSSGERILPPLSISDCIALVDRATRELDEPRPSRERLLRSVGAVYNYLNIRDDLHTSLQHYEWMDLDVENVDSKPGRADRDEIRFEPAVPRISALSLEATGGDCLIHYIGIIDEKGMLRDEHDYRKAPRLLRHGLPRREVFHLWRRTTVSRIVIEFSKANDRDPNEIRVVVTGGITNRPEHIKTALYHLRQASESVRSGHWSAAKAETVGAKRALEAYNRENRRR